MKLAPILFFLLALTSCISVPGKRMYVSYPDDSQAAGLWTCFPSEENEKGLVCVDWGDFMKAVQQRAREQEDAEIKDMKFGKGFEL